MTSKTSGEDYGAFVRAGARTKVLIAAVMTLAILAFAAPSAFAEACSNCKPWWHLTAEPLPTYLSPTNAPARDEVQEIVTGPGAGWELKVGGTSLGIFESEPYPPFGVTQATKENVQAALATVYGAGNVEVTGGPAGVAPLTITSIGEDSDNSVPSIEAVELVGAAKANVVTKGRPDGEIIVYASNLGDAPAGCTKVAAGTGQYTGSGCTEAELGTGEYEATPITLSDVVPAGFEAVGVSGEAFEGDGLGVPITKKLVKELTCSLKGENGVSAPACSFVGVVPPFMALTLHVLVNAAGASEGEEDRASVSGGGARPLSLSRKIPLGESTPFGIADYELVNENEGGGADTQAGSHPFQQTTTIVMNQFPRPSNTSVELGEPAVLPKDLHFAWPAGLVGNPSSIPQCPITDFLNEGKCPADTAVGVAKPQLSVIDGVPIRRDDYSSLFNLVPSPGEPARLGFISAIPIYIDPVVRSGRDYGITVNSDNISQLAGVRAVEVTVWGVPDAAIHAPDRGRECLADNQEGVECASTPVEHPPAFLSLPTACPGQPLVSTVTGDTWAEPKPTAAQPQLAEYVMPALDGCDALPFKPSIVATPDSKEASKPTGLNVDVHVPQQETLNPEGLSEAGPKDITVALPVGVAVNPSSADGLQACTGNPGALGAGTLGSPGDQIGFEGLGELPGEPGVNATLFSGRLPESLAAKVAVENGELPSSEGALLPGVNFCANASKLGTATVKTPILPNPLTGFVYLAAQESNPFGSLLAMYIVVEDPVSGTLVKLAGEISLCKGAGEVIGGLSCQAAGQLITTFENSPQAPFEDAEIHFFGGERAPLATPTRCGTYTTTAAFTPWAAALGEKPVIAESQFNIETGPNGSACPGAQLPFKPTLTGGATNVNAGAFSPFTATMSRLSGEQNLQSLEVHLPPGLSGILTGVELCPEPQANLGECGPNSLIGETTVAVGVGGEPYTVSGGKFYLTGPYNGTGGCTVGQPGCAPFGITFEVPAKAGPLDLAKTKANHPPCDCVLVRGKIEINPNTAAITITSNPPGTPDAIPTSLEGIPLEIQHVNAITTRNDFQFNPTNCSKMEVTGTIHSSEGGTDTIAVPFQVTNCAALKFEPKFAVSTNAKTSKAYGAALTAKVTEPAGSLGTQANLTRVKVELPKQLPSRLTTLQKACLSKQFETNPAACPSESKIGYAVVHTPLIPVPLEGPAIFVSHGGEAFPSLTIVLQGYGVTIDLVGSTFISKSGVTSTTFKTVPDQPFSSFQLTLPTGKYSALTALGNVCAEKLTMPTEFIAQNGMEIHRSTPITVEGCSSSLSFTHSIKKQTLKLSVYAPAAGKIIASGKGLTAVSKTAKGQENLTLTLKQKRAGKLKTTVNVTFTPSTGKDRKKQAKTAKLTFKT
jgi:hypothetical protein